VGYNFVADNTGLSLFV